MIEYLTATKKLADLGNYEEALRRLIWYYDYSFQNDYCKLRGVRNSFALSYWRDMSDKYPAALDAMKKIRDEKTSLLMTGDVANVKVDRKTLAKYLKGSREKPEAVNQIVASFIFADITALNKYLNESGKTIELFEFLDMNHPALAKSCWQSLEDKVMEAGNYNLAKKYINNYIKEFDRYRRKKEMFDKWKMSPHINNDIFVRSSVNLIKMAIATGDTQSAQIIAERSKQIVNDKRIDAALVLSHAQPTHADK